MLTLCHGPRVDLSSLSPHRDVGSATILKLFHWNDWTPSQILSVTLALCAWKDFQRFYSGLFNLTYSFPAFPVLIYWLIGVEIKYVVTFKPKKKQTYQFNRCRSGSKTVVVETLEMNMSSWINNVFDLHTNQSIDQNLTRFTGVIVKAPVKHNV
jgi:hypothetical protein